MLFLLMEGDKGLTGDLIFPLVVLLIGGLISYFCKILRERGRITVALISDINLSLKQAHDYKTYLEGDKHSWLRQDKKLEDSPVFAKAEKRVFNAALPFFWLLSKKELRKVLTFYSHVDNYEALIEILFGRIQKLESSQKILTRQDVDLIKARSERIVKAIDSVLNQTFLQNGGQKLERIKDLADDYNLESASETADKFSKAFED